MSGEVDRANKNFSDAKDRVLEQVHNHTLNAVEAEHKKVYAVGGFVSARLDDQEVQLAPAGSLAALYDRIKP